MGDIKSTQKIASGQVPRDVYDYLQAFAKSKGSTLSKQVCAILTDWVERRHAASEVDAAAHAVAAEAKAHYGPTAAAGPKSAPHRRAAG